MRTLQAFTTLLLGACILSACGKPEADTKSPLTKSKSLMNQWVRTDGVILDLSQSAFGANMAQIQQPTGYCQFSLLIAGSDDSGSLNVGVSTYHGSGSDPGCAAFNGVYSYSKSLGDLTVCKANGEPCTHYK